MADTEEKLLEFLKLLVTPVGKIEYLAKDVTHYNALLADIRCYYSAFANCTLEDAVTHTDLDTTFMLNSSGLFVKKKRYLVRLSGIPHAKLAETLDCCTWHMCSKGYYFMYFAGEYTSKSNTLINYTDFFSSGGYNRAGHLKTIYYSYWSKNMKPRRGTIVISNGTHVSDVVDLMVMLKSKLLGAVREIGMVPRLYGNSSASASYRRSHRKELAATTYDAYASVTSKC